MNKLEKSFKYCGYLCDIRRIETGGHLCGYVHLGPENKYYGLDYELKPVSVHGGLTYGEFHRTGLGVPDYVIGFDCAHAGDVIPNMYKQTKFRPLKSRKHLWTVKEVQKEIEQLVDQLWYT